MHVVNYIVNHPDIMAVVGDIKISEITTLEAKLAKERSRIRICTNSEEEDHAPCRKHYSTYSVI